jgi:hypothetical protein
MENENKDLSHYQLMAANQKRREIKNSKYQDKSKKRLSNIISTKLKTSFIGAISACETNFGFLWGHGKPDEELNENELAMKEIWENTRASILDNGNSQLRATQSELEHYAIKWEQYTLELPTRQQEN